MFSFTDSVNKFFIIYQYVVIASHTNKNQQQFTFIFIFVQIERETLSLCSKLIVAASAVESAPKKAKVFYSGLALCVRPIMFTPQAQHAHNCWRATIPKGFNEQTYFRHVE